MEEARKCARDGLSKRSSSSMRSIGSTAQQDAFLSYVEAGDITLIGATTENPSFEVNSALLSRCKVVVLPPLEREQVMTILRRAVTDPAVQKFGIEVNRRRARFHGCHVGRRCATGTDQPAARRGDRSGRGNPVDAAKVQTICSADR